MSGRKVLRIAVATTCGCAWTILLLYAVLGSAHMLGDPPHYDVASVLLLVLPWLVILGSLGVYVQRSIGRGNSFVTSLLLVGMTALLCFPAAMVLPRYDGDGMWPMSIWFGAILTLLTVGISTAEARAEPRVPPRPDVRVRE
jgi:hypothetical protein